MPKKTISEKLIKKIEIEETTNVELPKKKTLAQIAAKLNSKNRDSSQKIQLASKEEAVELIPTGILEVDYRLRGGFPRGRYVLLAGAESSWKSSTCLRTIAEAQKLGGTAAYIDAEGSFDGEYAQALGVDLGNLLLIKPDTAEQTYDNMTQLVLEGVDVVVLDSLNTLSPKKEMYEDDKGTEAASIEKEAMGIAARKISQWIRNNTGRIGRAKTLLMVITQLRDNINAGAYGNPDVIVGGRAIKFISSVTILTRSLTGKEAIIKDEHDEVIGRKFAFRFEKNKMGRDKVVGEFTAYGATIDNYTAMLKIGVKEGIITRPNNTMYEVGGTDWKFKGQKVMLDALVNPATGVYDHCEKALRAIMGTRIFHYDPYQKEKDIADAATIVINEDEDQNLIPTDE